MSKFILYRFEDDIINIDLSYCQLAIILFDKKGLISLAFYEAM